MDADDRSAPTHHDLGTVGFDALLHEVLGRMHGVLDEQTRLRLLLDAVVSMSADLSLDGVLDRIVQAASSLVGARYAALGVLGVGSERRLRTFVHHGISDEEAEAIGPLPSGHGLLGLIIDHPEPIRLPDIAAHPDSYGFPPHHPPMKSFLGVPLLIRGHVFGNLYLTDKTDAELFSEQDERIAVALASAAGVAIENAQLYEEATLREQWLAATAEVTAALSGALTGADALQTVADRAREVARADLTCIASGENPDQLELHVVSGAPITDELRENLALGRGLAALVVEKDEAMAVEDIASDSRAAAATGPDIPRPGPAILVPIRVGGGARGVLALAWEPEHAHRYRLLDAAMPATFAEQATLALELARARDDKERLAVLEDRDRIGRDLHDLVIQRLFAVGLGLQGSARLVDHPEVAARLERAVDDLDATIKDIRRTIFALGTTDAAGDIQSEATRLVERARSTLKFRPELEFSVPVRSLVVGEVAADVLAALGEALSNASRHADASRVAVRLSAGDEIVLTVADDGRGLPADFAESGLANIRSRAERRGGSVRLESEAGAGTRLVWAIPTPSSATD